MAEQKLLQLIISKVDGPVFDGEVKSVTIPGVDGEMTILPDHEPLISPLRKGIITIVKSDDSREKFDASQGTFEVSNNSATVLL